MANQISNVGFTDYGVEQASILRRQKLAQAMLQQGLTPPGPTESVGGWAIRRSPMEGLAKIAQAAAGAYGLNKSDERAMALAQRLRADRTSDYGALMTGMQGQPPQPAQAPLTPNDDEGNPMPGVPARPAVAGGQINPALIAQLRTPEAQAMAMQMLQKQNEPFTLAEGGKRFGPGAVPLASNPKQHPLHFQDTGAGVQPLDPMTGAPVGTPMPKTVSPDTLYTQGQENLRQQPHPFSTGPNGEIIPNKSVQDYEMAKAVAGRSVIANMMARGQDMTDLRTRELAAPEFKSAVTAERFFTSGKGGNTVRSFNVALAHLDTLDSLATAMHNNDVPAINKIGNAYAQQTGQAAPVNFDAAKKIVSDEIVKAIVGAGGGVQDREEAAKTINRASSPAQLKGVISTYKELMRGQLGGLRQQYEQTTGKTDFDKYLSRSGQQAAHGEPSAGAWSVVK